MPDAALVDGIRVQAAYNPHPQSAERFAARWGIEACEDLAGFFQAVDLVYVASPMKHMVPILRRRWNRGSTCYVKSLLL